MVLEGFLNSIKRGVLSPVYLFYGEEDYVQEKALKALKEGLLPPGLEAFNLDEEDGESLSPAAIVNLASTHPVMADKRVVIIKNPSFFKVKKKSSNDDSQDNSSSEEILLNYLKDPLQSTCLVFVVRGNADSRKKIFKAIKQAGQVLEFQPLRSHDLNDWIDNKLKQKHKNIEKEALEYLILSVGSNLRLLELELEKIYTFLGDEKSITYGVVKQLVAKTTQASIFELIDSVSEKKAEKALILLKEMIAQGEQPMLILFMLAKQFRTMLWGKSLVEQGYTDKQAAPIMQVHPFVASKSIRQCARYSFDSLEKAMIKIQEADVAMKRGTNTVQVLENVIVALCYN